MTTITFREQTLGRIQDFLDDEGLSCAGSQQVLAFLAGALLNFVDEGKEFFPEILFCTEIVSILAAFPGAVHYPIGNGPLLADVGRKVLKDCGPLSSERWYIYIERKNAENLRYGIFSYVKRPTTLSLREGISINPAIFGIILRKTSKDTVELRGSRRTELNIIFSTVRVSSSDTTPVQRFVKDCCVEISQQNRNVTEIDGSVMGPKDQSALEKRDQIIMEDFLSYFETIIMSSLRRSHGTILLNEDKFTVGDIDEFQDAIKLDPPLDFFESFRNYRILENADSILSLAQLEDILEGFLRCDGMISFDTKGRLTAYRIFYRPSSAAKISSDVVGGARRRAFEGIKSLIPSRLASGLFRSQDGQTLYYGGRQ